MTLPELFDALNIADAAKTAAVGAIDDSAQADAIAAQKAQTKTDKIADFIAKEQAGATAYATYFQLPAAAAPAPVAAPPA